MMIAYRYSRTKVSSIKALLDKFPCNEFNSPERSTVLNIAFWADTINRVLEICNNLDLTPPQKCSIEFEYKVAPPTGIGKESHTDVMLWWDTTCIGVEAKYTEPPYQVVSDWLNEGLKPENRHKVLEGWCSLIAKVTGKRCESESLADATYQMIHRIASVCSRSEDQKHIIYQIFDPTPEKISYYRAELARLKNILSTGSAIGLHISKVPVSLSDVYLHLIKEWRRNKTQCSEDVIAGLITRTLITCGVATVETI